MSAKRGLRFAVGKNEAGSGLNTPAIHLRNAADSLNNVYLTRILITAENTAATDAAQGCYVGRRTNALAAGAYAAQTVTLDSNEGAVTSEAVIASNAAAVNVDTPDAQQMFISAPLGKVVELDFTHFPWELGPGKGMVVKALQRAGAGTTDNLTVTFEWYEEVIL